MIRNISTYKIPFLFCLYLLFYSQTALCKKDPEKIPIDTAKIEIRKLDPQEQEKLLSDKDYKYDKDVDPVSESAWDKFINWLQRKFARGAQSKTGSYSIDVLEYILLAGAVVLIILLILKNDIKMLFYGKSASIAIDFKEFDEDIHKIKFDDLIAEALRKKDFRKAIRLHFLKLLKELTDRNLIKWQIDKTNKDYSVELKNSKYNEKFRELVLLYEYVWYGDFPMTESHFEETRLKFNRFDTNV